MGVFKLILFSLLVCAPVISFFVGCDGGATGIDLISEVDTNLTDYYSLVEQSHELPKNDFEAADKAILDLVKERSLEVATSEEGFAKRSRAELAVIIIEESSEIVNAATTLVKNAKIDQIISAHDLVEETYRALGHVNRSSEFSVDEQVPFDVLTSKLEDVYVSDVVTDVARESIREKVEAVNTAYHSFQVAQDARGNLAFTEVTKTGGLMAAKENTLIDAANEIYMGVELSAIQLEHKVVDKTLIKPIADPLVCKF